MIDITKNKKKVLFVITKSNFGGAQRYVYDLAVNLPKDKYSVAVATGGSGELTKRLELKNIRTVEIKNLVRDINIFSEFVVFMSLLKLYSSEKPDIIHLNSSKIGGLGSLAGRIYNIRAVLSRGVKSKIIFTAHGWAFKEDVGIIKKFIIYLLSWLTVVFCHNIITVSSADIKNAPRFPFMKKKISYIPNGITAPVFKDRDYAKRMLEKRIGDKLPEKTVLVVTIAELHRNKGLSHGLSTFSEIMLRDSNIQWFIIGDGEEKNTLKNIAEKLDISGNVHFLGNIQNASELLYAFDIFFLPSLKEGLPYVLLEAGFAGLPLVASDVGGISDIILNGSSGILFKPKNSREATEALHKLYIDEYKRHNMGNRNKKIVTEKFSLESMCVKTELIYKK